MISKKQIPKQRLHKNIMAINNIDKEMAQQYMSNDWTQRPSSAQGNLQSHPCFQSSLLDDGQAPGTIDEWRKSLVSNRPQLRMANINRNADDYDQNLEVKSYFQSFKHLRRLTISNPTNIQQYEVILLKRAKSYALVGLKGELQPRQHGDTTGRRVAHQKNEQETDIVDQKGLEIEERLDITTLEALKQAFKENQSFDLTNTSESGQMTLEEFTQAIRRYVGRQRGIEEQVENLFNKIDYNAEQIITWDELCTYLQLNFNERADADQRSKEIAFLIPAKMQKTPHRYPCSTIVLSADHQYLALGSDGTISVWMPNGELKIAKSLAGGGGIDQTLTARERLEKRKDQQTRSQPKWITDCQIIPEFNKVVVSTGDRELQFWDQTYCLSTTREVQPNDLPCTQVYSLDSVPIKVNYGISTPDQLILIYGDTDGCVNILTLHAAREIFRLLTTAERRKGIPTVSFDRFLDSFKCDYIRWQVHREWIENIYYDQQLDQIISCSNDPNTSVVIGCIKPSASSEIQLTETNGTDTKASRAKSAEPRSTAAKRRSTMSTDLTEDHTLPSLVNPRNKRDSTTSYFTQSSSQETHSRKAAGNENRHDVTGTSGTLAGRSNQRVHPIIRTPQTRCDADQTVFKIHKGVKTFDICTDKNILVTGGMDRVLRLWNPYLPSRPVSRLRGHAAPIFLVKIASEDNRLFSIAADKSVMVWDLIEHTRLACVRPKVHKIGGEIQAACYNPHTRCLMFASEKMSFLNIKLRPQLHADIVVSHFEPVLGLLFIKEFKQIISCTESGVIRLWDFLTGRQIHEFRAHGGEAITSMALDVTERRLVTSSRDGTCCEWNVHNGQLLKVLKRPRDISEVTDVTFIVVNNNCSILAVGWDRCVNVFKDDRERMKQVYFPEDQFRGDNHNPGHQEDILCIDKSPGDLIATGDYGGTVVIWNMSSKKIFATLKQNKENDGNTEENPEDRVINRIKFINPRYTRRDAANLITSGPYGQIHFWNIYKNGLLITKFRPNKDRITTITRIELDVAYRILFVADSLGFIFVYDIENYALKNESDPPRSIRNWRGHIDSITGLQYIEQTQILISSSLDWTIRLWNLQGHFIGTFGQTIPWNLYDPATYQHPLAPLDVLTDPKSLPITQFKQEESDRPVTPGPVVVQNKQVFVDDETIANNVRDTIEKLRQTQNNSSVGTRLRYFRETPTPTIRRDIQSHYQNLRFHPVDDNPPSSSNIGHHSNTIRS